MDILPAVGAAFEIVPSLGRHRKWSFYTLKMSHRTVMQAEICRSNPKMETVILLAKELNISLDALVFPETATPNAVPKCVYDFFRGKTESEAEKLIDICRRIDELNHAK